MLRKRSVKEESELLMAGVSSFGYLGAITHAVVQQAPEMCRRRDMVGAGASASSVFPNRVKFLWMKMLSIHFCNKWKDLALDHVV